LRNSSSKQSPYWTNPTGPVPSAGAATWLKADGTTVGFITPLNSLVGATAFDQVASNFGNVTLLANGNYVVASPYWNNPAGPVARVGAAQRGAKPTARQLAGETTAAVP